jgi:hypothetical protein
MIIFKNNNNDVTIKYFENKIHVKGWVGRLHAGLNRWIGR